MGLRRWYEATPHSAIPAVGGEFSIVIPVILLHSCNEITKHKSFYDNTDMGRTEKSQGLAPPAIRKDIRAKQARHIINKVIPAILASNSRARRGADGSELFNDPGPVTSADIEAEKEKKDGHGGDNDVTYVKRKGQGRRKVKERDEGVVTEAPEQHDKKGKKRVPLEDDFATLSMAQGSSKEEVKMKRRVRIITTDTLTAAHVLAFPSRYPGPPTVPTQGNKKKQPNTCILNMASPLRPGGGVLSGATSQEEFLCARTTLLPSLKDSFYRLPEVGGIYTHDVLVFRRSSSLEEHSGHLGPGERYWIDVITAGMLRFPELEGEEGEEKKLAKKDREAVEKKMRGVLRIACQKGVKKIVLGAWGCGAYGNPVKDIARAWRNVLDGVGPGQKKGKNSGEAETWNSIEDVVFAIPNKKMAREFATEFDGGIEVEAGPGGSADEEEEEEEDTAGEELRAKIKEMEGQIAQVWNPDLKTRMGTILEGLRAQLAARGSEVDEEDDDVEEEGDVSSSIGGKGHQRNDHSLGGVDEGPHDDDADGDDIDDSE